MGTPMGNAIAAWLMFAGAVAATTSGTPRDAVQTAVTRVVTVLQQGEALRPASDPAARAQAATERAEIRRIAGELFDFEEMARRALSRHWAQRTPAEQAQFVTLFTDMLERSYIGKIEAYSGERIVYLNEAVDNKYATVRSRVISKRRTETALDYRLHKVDGRWKVYDLMIDGVSFVATYRGEFNRAIQLSSYADLVEKMRKRGLDAVVVGRNARGS